MIPNMRLTFDTSGGPHNQYQDYSDIAVSIANNTCCKNVNEECVNGVQLCESGNCEESP